MFTGSLGHGIGGIVIDAVGTLIEPFPSVADVYCAAARRQGVELERSEIRERFRRVFRDDETDEARGSMVTDEVTEYRRWRRIVSRMLPELPDPERGFAELWKHFACPAAWRCFGDVAPALWAWRGAGIPVRVASNFDARLRAVVAGLTDLGGLESELVISSEVGFRKPHPAFYAAACASLGLPPGRVLCVGDDPEHDVFGPRRAGLSGVLVDRPGTSTADVPRVPALLDLLDLRADPSGI
jgi:putative hydrolase of the HAD superfamily